MDVDIQQHIETAKKSHRDSVEKYRSAITQLGKDIESAQKRESELHRELVSKQHLVQQAQAEGLDTAKLGVRVEELDRQIKQLAKERAAKQSEIDHSVPPSQVDFSRLDEMVEILKSRGQCSTATVVDGVAGCFEFLKTEITKCDDSGRPIAFSIDIGSGLKKEVTAVPMANRYLKTFRPDELAWLKWFDEGAVDVKSQEDDKRNVAVHAFVDSKTNRFVLSTTRFSWPEVRETTRYDGRVETKYINNETDLSDVATSLDAYIVKLIEVAGNPIVLEQERVDSPLVNHIRSIVMSETTDTHTFLPCTETASSPEIMKRTMPDWDAIVRCPWGPRVVGELARLKYYAENRETPRMWSLPIEGHYGFRLRTRDHDWITGELYLAPGELPSSGLEPMQIHSVTKKGIFGSPEFLYFVARLGRLRIKIDK